MRSLKHAHFLVVERENPCRLRRPRWSSRGHNGIIEPPKKMIAGDKRSKGLNASWTTATFGRLSDRELVYSFMFAVLRFPA